MPKFAVPWEVTIAGEITVEASNEKEALKIAQGVRRQEVSDSIRELVDRNEIAEITWSEPESQEVD